MSGVGGSSVAERPLVTLLVTCLKPGGGKKPDLEWEYCQHAVLRREPHNVDVVARKMVRCGN